MSRKIRSDLGFFINIVGLDMKWFARIFDSSGIFEDGMRFERCGLEEGKNLMKANFDRQDSIPNYLGAFDADGFG